MIDVPIYGRIATLELFRPHNETQDFLFIATERYKFCVLQWDGEKSELLTRAMGDVSDRIGRPTDNGQIGIIDPDCRLIGLHLYDGLFKVIPFDNKGQLKEAFNIRLEELQVLDIKFLYGCVKPTIVVLYQDNKDARHVKTYEVALKDKDFVEGPWSQNNLDNGAGLLIPVPAPLGGVIIIGEETIVYCNANSTFRAIPIKQLVKLNLQADPNGSYVEVLERYVNLGPIVDFCVVDLDRQGQGQVVTCSGAFKDGSLRVVRNGIGINEQASVELQGIKGLWSLKSSFNDPYDMYLVVSFISETRFLAMNMEDELEETEIEGFDAQTQTLFCQNAINDLLIQVPFLITASFIFVAFLVTANSVRLVSCTSRELVDQWNAPEGFSVNVASANASQVLLATGGGHLVYLEIKDSKLVEVKHIQLEHEISCVDLNPIGENPQYSSLAAVGMWTDISVRILSLPDLELIRKENLGGEIVPRSVLLCTLEGVSYLLCALGDGHLFSFLLNASTGELTDRKKVSLGTQPISLRTFSSKGTTHVFASSDRPTVIYSSNKKLLYSNVNLKEVNHMCPFNTAAIPDSLAIAKEGELSIGTIDDIQKLHIRTIPLNEQARRICHQEQSRTLAFCSFKHNQTSIEESETHFVRLLDHQTFEFLSIYQLDQYEHGCSIISCSFSDDNNVYYCVGTAYVLPEENEPSKGRILVFAVEDGRLQLIVEKETKGAVYSLNAFNGKLLAAINQKIQLYKWMLREDGSHELQSECGHHGHILALYTQTRGDFIVVGDLMKSISLLVYKHEESAIEELARDYNANWMSAVEMLDDEIYIGAENNYNIFTVRKNSDAATDEERGRLEVVGEYHLGEFVNRLRHGSLVMRLPDSEMGQIPTVIFGTINGVIGIIASLPHEQYVFLEKLQSTLVKFIKGVGNLSHEQWRSFHNDKKTSEARNFLDGDLIESFLDLSRNKMEEVAKVSLFLLFLNVVPSLRDKAQVEQLLRYIVEEVPEDSEKKRSFKFPFIACEIFTCEIDIILRTLVEDEELMDLLFSFVRPGHPHSTLLAGYFSKEHPDIVVHLVDLIGTTSIMEVLIRLIGADETIYSNYADTLQWLENTDVLEMIVDKFSSSKSAYISYTILTKQDSPEVHANAAEILSAVTRCAPPALAAKICSPSFVGRLFRHALQESRPKSVLVHSLSVCISLLDPKRLASASYQAFRSNLSHGTLVTASPETVDGMLESLGDLLKLLDISSAENVLPTTYGCLQPPLGKHRLKIVEFISVLLTIGSETAEQELINQSAVKRSIDLFFQYPYNNFLHHHVESIIISCLEVNRSQLIDHALNECNLVGKILAAERSFSLSTESNTPTLLSEGKVPPKIGNIGHITRIANKLIQLGNSNSIIQSHLQENSEWVEWQTTALVKRNEVENVYHWACGRPTSLHDRGRDSDDDDFRDRDYDVAALANNLSQAFRYGMYSNDDIEEAQVIERDDEDVYFDDESAEVVISSLRLGDDQDSSSLFTNSNWFTFDGDRGINDRLAASVPSSSPNSEETSLNTEETDEVQIGEDTSIEPQLESVSLENGPVEEAGDLADVSKQTDSNTEDEKLLCTEEEDLSKEAEESERHVDVRDGQVDIQAEDAAEGSCGDMGTGIAVDEPVSPSSEPNNASAGASPDTGDIHTAGSTGSNDSGAELHAKEDSQDGQKTDEPTTTE
uniref:DNA damage-binding protein 1 n=1 Tax=Oryza barthii TaxID=65489 RepID=A0A0D3GBK3_9ORYZ